MQPRSKCRFHILSNKINDQRFIKPRTWLLTDSEGVGKMWAVDSAL
jgi:hypothetical protein